MDSMILNQNLNKIDRNNMNIYEKIGNELQILPKRFHREYLQDVVMSVKYQDNTNGLRKCTEYYYCDIHNELSNDEKIKIYGVV